MCRLGRSWFGMLLEQFDYCYVITVNTSTFMPPLPSGAGDIVFALSVCVSVCPEPSEHNISNTTDENFTQLSWSQMEAYSGWLPVEFQLIYVNFLVCQGKFRWLKCFDAHDDL